MKLWQKQKRGKKRLSAQSNLDLPPEIFHKLYTQE
jgi:translation elongation factor EF-4